MEGLQDIGFGARRLGASEEHEMSQLILEGCNSQESDTFGSLDHLPEAGPLSSQMEADSQELAFEVEASGSQSQSQSQLSTDVSEVSAEASLEGNFPAVNLLVPGKNSPLGKTGSEATKDTPKGKGVTASKAASRKDGKGTGKDAQDKGAKDKKDAKSPSTGAAPEKGQVAKKAVNGGKASQDAPMEAEVDAADVLLSLSMSAARRSGRNSTETVPPAAQAGPPRKRCLFDRYHS